MCFGGYLSFDSKVEVSIARYSLTMMGHGFLECSLSFLSLKNHE